MITRTLIFFIIVLLMSCQKRNNESIEMRNEVVIDYVHEGKEYMLKGYVNSNDLLHGFAEVFTKSGKKQFEGSFYNGKINGMFTTFHEDGSKSSAQYLLGKMDGLLIDYYPVGKPRSISVVKEGKYWYTREYYPDGRIDTTYRFLNLTYGTYKANSLIITYRFEDPFFESGFIQIHLADSVGRSAGKERIPIINCDSTVLSKPLKPGAYMSEIEFLSNYDDELLYRFVPTTKFKAVSE